MVLQQVMVLHLTTTPFKRTIEELYFSVCKGFCVNVIFIYIYIYIYIYMNIYIYEYIYIYIYIYLYIFQAELPFLHASAGPPVF